MLFGRVKHRATRRRELAALPVSRSTPSATAIRRSSAWSRSADMSRTYLSARVNRRLNSPNVLSSPCRCTTKLVRAMKAAMIGGKSRRNSDISSESSIASICNCLSAPYTYQRFRNKLYK